MRLHNFFVTEQLDGKSKITISDRDLIHQWKNVFRFKSGDKLVLLDSSNYKFLFKINSINNKAVDLELVSQELCNVVFRQNIYICSALFKKDHFEWALEKCTELGVAGFYPVVSERSEIRDLNMVRSQKIIKEAAEQCGRGTLPTIHEAVSLQDFLENFTEESAKGGPASGWKIIALHLDGEKFSAENFTKNSPQDIAILIGPEGGWSEREVALFKEKNIPIFSLGSQTLRAETAAVAVSSLLLLS